MASPLIIGFSEAERAALLAALDRAANGNPRLVRAAFLAAPRRVPSPQSKVPGPDSGLRTLDSGPSLRPVVLSDWLALEELNHFAIVGGPHSLLDDAHLVYILAHDPHMVRAALANGRQTFSVTAVAYIEQFPDGILTHLGPCALCQLRLANSTVINSQRSTGGDPFSHLPGKTSGCGWALDLADVFANEYGWSHAAIWDEIPLVALFAYYAAIKARYETKASGPSYAEQDLIAARRTAAADSQPLTLDTPPPQ